MKTINDFFDMAKEKSGSDYATAKAIGITPNRISMARKANGMNNKMARQVAEYIGVNPIEIIAAAEAEKHPEEAKAWGKWIAAASVILALVVTSQAIDFNTLNALSAFTPLYIMRT